MKRNFKGQAGFSLVELLVAILILAVGLLGLAELQISTMKANAQSDSIMVANHLAQKIVEEIAAATGDDPRFTSAGTKTWIFGPNDFVDIAGAGVYNVTYTVTLDHAGVGGLSQIVINVASAGAVMNVLGNRQRLVSMATLKRTF